MIMLSHMANRVWFLLSTEFFVHLSLPWLTDYQTFPRFPFALSHFYLPFPSLEVGFRLSPQRMISLSISLLSFSPHLPLLFQLPSASSYSSHQLSLPMKLWLMCTPCQPMASVSSVRLAPRRPLTDRPWARQTHRQTPFAALIGVSASWPCSFRLTV